VLIPIDDKDVLGFHRYFFPRILKSQIPLPLLERQGEKRLKTQPATVKLGEYIKNETFFKKKITPYLSSFRALVKN
jgi:hypothetical protein